MRCEPLEPVGVRVTGVAPGTIDDTTVAQLRDLLAEHGVLVLPGVDVDDATFVAFLRRFGPLAFTQGEAHAPGFPDLNVVSNVGRATPPRSTFHVDTSYVRVPPAYTALRAVTIPARGGETLFTNQYRALQTLPHQTREQLVGRTMTHVVTGLDLDEEDEISAEHPLVRPHPLSGRPALYLTTPSRCAAISGMTDDEAAALVARLTRHSTREDNILRHAWSPGDLVMWDNACVLHRGDHAAVAGDRVMHRGMVAGTAPVGPVPPARAPARGRRRARRRSPGARS